MVNVNKLKGKIVENGFTLEEFAEAIDIDRSTLYRKFNGNCENVTINEADKMVKTLRLSSKEAASIFFAHYVAHDANFVKEA